MVRFYSLIAGFLLVVAILATADMLPGCSTPSNPAETSTAAPVAEDASTPEDDQAVATTGGFAFPHVSAGEVHLKNDEWLRVVAWVAASKMVEPVFRINGERQKFLAVDRPRFDTEEDISGYAHYAVFRRNIPVDKLKPGETNTLEMVVRGETVSTTTFTLIVE